MRLTDRQMARAICLAVVGIVCRDVPRICVRLCVCGSSNSRKFSIVTARIIPFFVQFIALTVKLYDD
jgi:hypothetical protein